MANDEGLSLKWKRPDNVEYPKVWHTFMARDLDSDQLVEYRIEDLPFEKIDEVFEHMQSNYIQDEPIGQVLGGIADPDHIWDYKMVWRPMIAQKLPLVCYKSGSDEIVGANMLFALTKDDDFLDRINMRFKSRITKDIFDLMMILYENFNTFEHYGVDKYLTSFGLSVDRKYRGRAIGDQLLATRKLLCKEFGFKFTHTFFTSDYSNRNADKAGFKTDVAIKYEDVIKTRSRLEGIRNIKSKGMTIKTMMCNE